MEEVHSPGRREALLVKKNPQWGGKGVGAAREAQVKGETWMIHGEP